ncbi:MAG: tyrosine decarboxylase MnfA [Methanosphaera sp. rholeuAM74]|nr:MAG: tyrosine decarboxylase MnfA [Methanosphaera sp. rholeuAM74]
MLDDGRNVDSIFRDLEEFKKMNMTYESGRILGSMCTKPDPIGLKAYKMFIETNLGDPGLFEGSAKMESQVIDMLGKLLHLDDASGHIVTGGTEANFMAMTIAKYLFLENNSGVPEVILPCNAHFSFKKICPMLSVKPVYVPLKDYRMDCSVIEEYITDNTMAIVALAGSTELGLVDDIARISEIAQKNRLYLHVDAAFGGFIIPFMKNDKSHPLNFDFSCEGVDSITIDPHKMGLAPVPAGGIIIRDKKHLEKLSVKTPYLTKEKQTTVVGTRTGASTAATWTLLNYYGKSGYKRIVNESISLTKYTYNQLKQIPQIKLTCKPDLNIISFKVENMDSKLLQRKLLKLGWRVSVSENPYAMRLVLMPHVKKEHITEFIKTLKKVIEEK